MKSLITITAVLAASQCVSEPSGSDTKTSPDGGVAEASADSGTTTPTADAAGSSTAKAAAELLAAGPPPFTVPTQRIAWPQQKSTVLVPQGAKIVTQPDGTLVSLGEGRNFAFYIAPHDPLALSPARPPREDGAFIWNEGEQWYFRVQQTPYDCWNPIGSTHDRSDVEMMIASCKSIERQK